MAETTTAPVVEDVIREYLQARLRKASVANVIIELSKARNCNYQICSPWCNHR